MGNDNERDSDDKYCTLRDVQISLDSVVLEQGEENRGFSLCFWIYLLNSARPCSVILHQVTNFILLYFLFIISFFLAASVLLAKKLPPPFWVLVER